MKRLSIFLTGSSGFIGRNILEQLASQHTFLAPSHKELDLLDVDAVSRFFQKNKIDIVIHCANIGGSRNMPYLADFVEEDLRMFCNLVYHREKFGKMIYFGSGAEYDKSKPIRKVTEEEFGIRIPQDQYGFYKFICTAYIKNIPHIINLRLFGVYGKYEDYSIRFISNNLLRVLFGLPITISQNTYFDYVYIDDLVRIVNYFITNTSKHTVYNIGRGDKMDLLSLATRIKRLTKTTVPIHIAKKGLKNEFSCRNTKLMEELGTFEFEDTDTSIKKLYGYYKKNLSILSENLFLPNRL